MSSELITITNPKSPIAEAYRERHLGLPLIGAIPDMLLEQGK